MSNTSQLSPHITLRQIAILAALLLAAMFLSATPALAASCNSPVDPKITVDKPQVAPGNPVTVKGMTLPGNRVLVDGLGLRKELSPVPTSGEYMFVITVPAGTAPGCYELQVTTGSPSGGLASFGFARVNVVEGATPPGDGAGSCPDASVSIIGKFGPAGTKYAIQGMNWIPGGVVSVRLPYGSAGIFYFDVAEGNVTVLENGTWLINSTVGGPTPPGNYISTATEPVASCPGGKLERTVTYTVQKLPQLGCSFTPDKPFFAFDFKNSCNKHDDCYVKNGGAGVDLSVKDACDDAFLKDMLTACGPPLNDLQQSACSVVAYTYFLGVQTLGKEFFLDPDAADRAGTVEKFLKDFSPVE